MRNVLKKSIFLLLILFIPLAASTASADFVGVRFGYLGHYAEAIYMILIGVGLFGLASLFRMNSKS